MADTLVLVPLHDEQYRHLIGECFFMLNSEWKRSFGMRQRTLNQSSEEFPYNVILVKENKLPSPEALVGHARFTRVIGNPKAVYMSAVIIHTRDKRKGFGRKLMEMIDAHMKEKGFRTIYVIADVMEFYIKCGYEVCDPIQEVTNMKMASIITKLNELYQVRSHKETKKSTCGSSDFKCSNDTDTGSVNKVLITPLIAPPAPPLPPPPLAKKTFGACKGKNSLTACTCRECSTWMKKILV